MNYGWAKREKGSEFQGRKGNGFSKTFHDFHRTVRFFFGVKIFSALLLRFAASEKVRTDGSSNL